MSYTTTKEMAQNIGIAQTTVREWVKQFSVPTRRKKGKLIYDEEAKAVLETIKRLKGTDAGIQTIKRRIGPYTEQAESKHGNNKSQNQKPESEHIQDIAQTIENAVDKAIIKNNDLSEKYARATFEIGQLQERVTNIQTQLENKETQIKALPIPIEHEKLKLKLEQTNQNITEKDETILTLNNEIQTPNSIRV